MKWFKWKLFGGKWVDIKRESKVHNCDPPGIAFHRGVAAGSIWRCHRCDTLWELVPEEDGTGHWPWLQWERYMV